VIRHNFTSLFSEERLGSWLAIHELGCQCYWTGLETCEYLLCGQLHLRHQTPWLPYSECRALPCSFPQTVCRHRLGRGPHYEFCKRIDLRQCPTNLLAPRCHPSYAFASSQYRWGTHSAFASRCSRSLRGCTKSNPIRKCCSYLLSIVLLVPWRRVTGWLQWLCIVS